MTTLKIVYTEHDKSVQLYRDCDIEAVCRGWLQSLVDTKEINFVYHFIMAQELCITTMQMLLVRDFAVLSYDDVLFYMEDYKCTMGDRLGCRWMFIDDPFPADYPHYSTYSLEVVLCG